MLSRIDQFGGDSNWPKAPRVEFTLLTRPALPHGIALSLRRSPVHTRGPGAGAQHGTCLIHSCHTISFRFRPSELHHALLLQESRQRPQEDASGSLPAQPSYGPWQKSQSCCASPDCSSILRHPLHFSSSRASALVGEFLQPGMLSSESFLSYSLSAVLMHSLKKIK